MNHLAAGLEIKGGHVVEYCGIQSHIERSLEGRGVRASLRDCHWPSPTSLSHISDYHSISLALTSSPGKVCRIPDLPTEPLRDVGNVCLLPAGVRYCLQYSGGSQRLVNLFILKRKFEAVTGFSGEWNPAVGLNFAGAHIDRYLYRLAQELSSPGIATIALVEGLSLVVVSEVARYLGNISKAEVGRKKLTDIQLARIRDFVENACASRLTIKTIAELIGVSSRHITDAFRHTTGQTIHQYISNVRVQRASSMLSSTKLPVKEIAYQLGFSSLESFSTAFRMATGQAPTSYRRLFAQPPGPDPMV